MKASELVYRLQGMIKRHGDLEVLVETANEVIELQSKVDLDKFDESESSVFVLETTDSNE